ncbi:MAG: hypothetical protein M3256_11125 [Actinomycetota bacterium]|nr:hypothetical protein [Actinomycetota bacterium]
MSTTTATGRDELPPPLVHFAENPRRWIGIKIELLVAAVTLAHVGMFIVVALYYLLTQKNAAIKNFWDNTLVTNRDLRHSIRDVGEGILGGFLAQGIVWNHFAKSHLKAGRVLRRLHERLHVPEVPLALLGSAVFGAIGFCALYYGLHAVHVHASAYASRGSVWHRTQNIWRSGWDKKAMGYAAAFVARRPLHLVFDDAQEWFAQRQVELDRGPRLYQPPTFKARVNDIAKTARDTHRGPLSHGPVQSALMVGGLVAGLGLAGYGYYILIYIA